MRRSVCLGSLKINVGDFKLKKEEDEKDTISEMRDGPYSSSVIDGSSGVSHAARRQKYSLIIV